MYGCKILLSMCLIFLLFACGTDSALEEPAREDNTSIELTKISASNQIDQDTSNQAKEILSNYDEITSIKAANTEEDLLIAIEVHHNKRLKLAKIRKELSKEMEKQFSDKKVEFTTDKKIVLELDQLEKNIQSGDYSKKKLEKELKKLIKLSKEQT